MSVIIRLQGLPWTASAMNIRHFFTGLNIPAGGVHIIGGEGGDAFIAFSSDEDARVAMKMNMSPLNGMPVQLFLSSKSEMQSVIDAARSSGPSTVSSSQNIPQVPAMPGNMAQTGMGQAGVTGVNPMGVPTGKPMMPNLSQPPQMSGFQGMQGHHGQAQMMGQKNNFQNMQQAMDMNQHIDGSGNAMAGGGNNNNNMMGGGMNMGGRNEWQGYPGMDGMADNQNQSMNMAQFQNSQNMMGGGQGNQFSRFQNMRQQQLQQNQEDSFSASGQRDMMSGRQGFGQDMSAAKGKMDHAGGMMSQNQSQGRFDESGMRPSWMGGGGMAEKPGQFPGMADKNIMNQGFSPSQRSGSASKDESITAVAGQMGHGPESMATGGFSKDRFGRNQMPLEQTESANTSNTTPNMDAWGGEKKMENFPDSRSRFEPDNRRDQMFRQDMGRREEPPFRQEGRKRVNRFAEVPENPEATPPGPFSMGMNRGGDSDAGFSDRETRMPDQFHNRFRSSHEPSPGRLPERAQGRLGGDRGSQAGTEDGLPSTRYPPDDEVVPPVPDSSRFMGGRGLLDQPRGMPEDNRIMTGDRRNLPDGRRDMRDDRMGMVDNHLGEDRRSMPEDRRGMPDDRRGMPDDRRAMPDDRRAMPDDRRAMPDDRRAMPDDRRAMPDDRRFRQRASRFDREQGGMSMEQDERFPPNDRRFPPEERGFPGNRSRFPPNPNDRFGDDMGREFPADDRFPPERSFQDSDRDGRIQGGDDRKFPPGEGRPMPEDRMGMWPEDKMRDEDMIGRRPGDNMFAPDDPRFREREEELRREAFERGPRGPDERFMYGRGRGGMRGMGRPGGDYYGMRPFPPDRRGGFPPERQGGFRGEDEQDYPYGPDGYPEGPDRWNRFDRMPDKDGLLDKPGGMGGADPERKPLLSTPEDSGSLDMDQRFDRDMGPERGGRRPDMFREDGGFDYGHGPPMDEGFGRGAPPPRDFDSRAVGPRGRGGPPMMDRGPRGRGEPFSRGRHGGMPPFARGREREGEGMFEEQGPMVQDVDNRKMEERFLPKPDQQGMPVPERPVPGAGGRGLLGDAPVFPGQSNNSRKEDQKGDAGDKDVDSRAPRRSDDRDRDRRHNDDRRGRDREDRDRYSYRGGRYDRDRERDRDRSDRRRSRSRSRDRGGRDSRYSRENRERSSKDKSSKSDTDLSKSDSSKAQQRQTRFLLVKNMPPTLSFRDLRRFFQPMEIPFDGIKVINDKDGNRIGEANVYFSRLEDAIKAQKRNGDRVEGRPVSILFSTEDDFNKAVDSFVPGPKRDDPTSAAAKPQDGKMRYIAQLKNLPASITRQDINTFFKNLKIDKEGEAAYIEFDQSGVATGVGFVEFKSDTDYKKALTQDGNKLGANNVRVLPGKTDEADKLKAVQGEMFQRAALRNIASKVGPLSGQRPNLGPQLISQLPVKQSPQQPSPTPPHMKPLIPPLENNEQDNICVHIQGLPLLATSHDIREFFSDCQIATRGINIAHDGSGKPLGEGFVEFKFKSGVEKALKKDKTSLGRHIVAVKPISKKEMTDRLGGVKHQGDGPPKLPTSIPGPPSSQSSNSMGTSQSPQVQKIPFPKAPQVQENPARNNQQIPPQQQQQQQQQQQHQQQRNNQMTPQQQQQQQRNNQQQPRQQQQAQQNQAKLPDTPDSKGPPSNPNQQRPSTQDMGNNGPMGGQQMGLLQTPQGPPLVVAPGGGKSFPPGVLNSNWFYIRCQNFPADISIAEIMQFFNTFRPIGESIRLHYSSEGHPTGNAVVGFNTAEDANRAMQALSMKFSRHNPVSLHPA